MELSRRYLLRHGSAAALLGAAGVGGLTTAAHASVPASSRFDLADPSTELFRFQMLHESHHAMQGFAFDNVNRLLYVAQLQDKGSGGSGDDLCINHVSFGGTVRGHMHLANAGHGVSIGAEGVGSDSYIWTECDSDDPSTDGRGTALARFKFVDGATPKVTKFLQGSKGITCAIDPVVGRLIVRRLESGVRYYSVYSLTAAARGDFSNRLAHFREPSIVTAGTDFQGYTVYGSYLYTMDGTTQADESTINSYVTCISLNTGAVVSRKLTAAGRSLVYREPEGMAVYRTSGGETRLMMGFASRSSRTSPDRYASIYYKNALIAA